MWESSALAVLRTRLASWLSAPARVSEVTRCRTVIIREADRGDDDRTSGARVNLLQLFVDDRADAQRIRRDRQAWIGAAARREERRIDDIQIVEVVSPVVLVQNARAGFVAEPARSADVAVVDVVFAGIDEADFVSRCEPADELLSKMAVSLMQVA